MAPMINYGRTVDREFRMFFEFILSDNLKRHRYGLNFEFIKMYVCFLKQLSKSQIKGIIVHMNKKQSSSWKKMPSEEAKYSLAKI